MATETRHTPPRAFAPLDAVLIVLLAISSFAAIPAIRSHAPPIVVVHRDDSIIARYPLSEDRQFTISGDCGQVQVTIARGKVQITASSCRKQICTRAGAIGKPQRQLICAPNHILVEIQQPNGAVAPDAIVK
jgi:hypothetical protein